MNVLPEIKPETRQAEDGLWFKDAIIYQLHVKAFADSNNDGIGDFAGLTSRLDYLQDLGVTALWLLPFYPSPGRDDGYDIADYRRINPDFGSMKDFRRFLHEAKRRNLRVITELVVNHTSDQHPWFRRARRSKPWSDARNWYVWSDNDQKYAGTRVIFNDTEKSNWQWDPEANAYYWHRFFSHQPDLNFDNPRVLWAVVQVMRKWLDMGVDGFRLDAIPYLCEREGTSNENLSETHAIIKKIRAELDAHAPGKLLLAEANQWPEDVSAYFGDGDECHMAYHFPLMPRIYMAIAQEDRFPIADILRQTPNIPENCQWALFLRNHDELTLEMVTDSERDYLWSTYAADRRARINLGIRRRLATLMDNDRRKIELMTSLLMSLPGTPIIYYGDEIGMGDNIYLGDRNGVRTPMQWTPDRNAGFSRCDPARLYLPVIMDPVYGYEAVNVEAQSRSLSSLLSWTKKLISVRKAHPVFGRGTLSFIRPANRAVLVYLRQHGGKVVMCVANLSRFAQAAEIDLSEWRGRLPLELMGQRKFPPVGDTPYVVTLVPYGFFWFELCEPAEAKAETPVIMPEFETLIIGDDWSTLERGHSRVTFEHDVLPAFIAGRRWFADKGRRRPAARCNTLISLGSGQPGMALALIDVTGPRETARYVMPLGVKWTRFTAPGNDLSRALAAVRRGPREGTLMDVAADPDFITLLLNNVEQSRTVEGGGKRLEFRPTAKLQERGLVELKNIRPISGEQSNSTALVGADYVVKVFRRVQDGINPEIEIGRFLTDVAGFPNAPTLFGSVELVDGDTRNAIAVVHAFIDNQGDAWTVTNAYLDRFVEAQRLLSPDDSAAATEQESYLLRIQPIGRQVARLQIALASRDDILDFAPEPITRDDVDGWIEGVMAQAQAVFGELRRRRGELKESDRELVRALLEFEGTLRERLVGLLPDDVAAMKIRHHGDLHLGQMLWVKDDIIIVDFEGEPRRPIAERRRRAPAARDVAGVIRSIDYSATAALDRATRLNPDEGGQLAAALEGWREQASLAFWQAYRSNLTDKRLWPADREQADRLLDFFLLEKAIYEIGYELANRPEWLRVPLKGTLRILAGKPLPASPPVPHEEGAAP
jgi:maltose alpha-D-glucosyltransferase/alpha-amylase